MMKKFFFAWPIAALFLTGGLTRLHGATNYWDNNGDVAGFGTAGGIWGVEAKWSVDPAGASEPTGTNTTTDDDLFFGVDSVGLGAGTITVQGAQGFRSISFGETSGTMLLTNGTLTLARPFSALCLHNPTNEIASALTGSGGLHKITAETSCTYNQYLPTSAVVIVSNQSLAKLKDVTAVLGGKSISGGSATAVPYNLTHDGATITFQLQVINGGEFIKCVRVELTQTGPDISARAVYAKYIKTSAASLGFDFDGGGTKYTVATDPSMDGYGVSQITFLFGPRTSLRLSGVNTYTGDTQLEEGGLEIVGAGQLGGGSYTGTIQLAAGDLLYRSLADQRFEGPITGAGKLIRESAGLRTEACVYTQFLPTVAQVIYTNKLLSTCVAVTGLLGGKSILFGQQPISASVYHYMQTPTKITYQLQALDGPHLKCVKVELTQMANGVAARAVAAWYFTGGALGFNFDAGGGTGVNIATSYNSDYYGAAASTATFQDESVLTLAGTNSYTGGTELRSGMLEVVSTNGLSSTGMIRVNGGEMILRVLGMNVGNSGGVGNNNTLFVNSGGTLTLAREFNAGFNRLIQLDGGTLNCTFFQNNDSANYVNRLILRNGARAIGYKLRVGYLSSVLYTVAGSAASVIESGLDMARQGSETMTFDVGDVTADPLADLTVSGVIRDYNESLSGLPFIKTGAGTLCLSGANTHVGIITVNDGAIALGTNNTLNAGNPLKLNGGAIEIGAFTNTLGTLTVTADSGLTLGSGRIAFADSSAVAWSGTLALTGTLHRFAVRFGTDGSGLTAAQVSAIRVNGDYVRLRDDGYLAPGLKGTRVIVF